MSFWEVFTVSSFVGNPALEKMYDILKTSKSKYNQIYEFKHKNKKLLI